MDINKTIGNTILLTTVVVSVGYFLILRNGDLKRENKRLKEEIENLKESDDLLDEVLDLMNV